MNIQFPLSPLRIIVTAALAAFAAAVFQVVFMRVISYVFPFQMIFAISLVTGSSIFFTGLGALFANVDRPLKRVLRLAALATPLSLLAMFLFKNQPIDDYQSLAIATAAGAIPFTFHGMLSGLFLQTIHLRAADRLPQLIGFSAVAWFVGLTGAAFLITHLGIINLALGSALILALLSFEPSVALVGGAFLLIFLGSANLEERIFPRLAGHPFLWKQQPQAKFVAGGWSPYARVDMYDLGQKRLAGLYNGVQYWLISPPEQDIVWRRRVYEAITGSVLVIGSGGGQGLRALSRASRIEAVELDPLVIGLLQGHLASWNDGVYNRAAIVQAGDGRAYLDRTQSRFDTIIYEAAEVSVSNYHKSFIALENYLYTSEAMTTAFDRLKPDGFLLIIHTDRYVPRERYVKAFPAGVQFRTLQVTTTIPGFEGISFATDVTLASRNPETMARWLPLLMETDSSFVDQTAAFMASDRFREDAAVTDDRPVLFLRRPTQLIPFAVAAALLLGTALAMASRGPGPIGFLFFLTGISFMLAQLFLINLLRATLNGYIETSSIALGLFTLASAFGALACSRIPPCWALPGLLPAFLLTIIILTHFPFAAGTVQKLLMMSLAIVPTAFFSGTFFPRGFRHIPAGSSAWYLAIDTIASGGGFLLFYLLTAIAGFSAAGLAGCAGYVAAGLLLAREK